MEIFCDGIAVIEHTDTGVQYEIEADELEWEVTGSSEGGMGPEYNYEAEIEHEALGRLVWGLGEYPVGIEDYRNYDFGKHKLIENLEYRLQHSDEGDEYSRDTSFEEYWDGLISEIVKWAEDQFGSHLEELGPYEVHQAIEKRFKSASDELLVEAMERIELNNNLDWGREDFLYDDDVEKVEKPKWEITELPQQVNSPQFEIGADGRIQFALTGELNQSELKSLEGLLTALTEAVEDAVAGLLGTNAHTSILSRIHGYQEILSKRPLAIDLLFASGVRLENARSRLFIDIEAGELPKLPANADEALSTLLDLHGVVITSTERGRQLLQHSMQYANKQMPSEKEKAIYQQIAKAMSAAKGVISDEVAEYINQVVSEMGQGPHPERSMAIATSGINNVLSMVATIVLPTIGTDVLVGMGAVEALNPVLNASFAFVNDTLPVIREYTGFVGVDMSWLSGFVSRFENRQNVSDK